MTTTSDHLGYILDKGIDKGMAAQGLCAGEWETFFPEENNPRDVQYRYRTAKAICADCPVSIECLDGALKRNEEYGVWGGLTPHERMRLRRGRVA